MTEFLAGSHRLFRRAVLGTALLPAMAPIMAAYAGLPAWPIAVWTLWFVLFLGAMWVAMSSRTWQWSAIGVQIGAALGATTAFPTTTEGAMLVAATVQVATRKSLKAVSVLVVAQSAAYGLLMWWKRPLAVALDISLLWMAFEAFAALLTHVARSEAEGRTALSERNVELVAAQHLLADEAGRRERDRIARDLHDGLGHHLAALSLNLEAAAQLADTSAREHVDRAQAVARTLLAEVRRAVADTRHCHDDPVPAIRAMVAAIHGPQVHLDLPSTLPLEGATSEAVVRLVQEMLTNTLRHALARNVWVSIRRDGDGLEVLGRDDGSGAMTWQEGTGLRGMRQRLLDLDGALEISSSPGGGFAVAARLPYREHHA